MRFYTRSVSRAPHVSLAFLITSTGGIQSEAMLPNLASPRPRVSLTMFAVPPPTFQRGREVVSRGDRPAHRCRILRVQNRQEGVRRDSATLTNAEQAAAANEDVTGPIVSLGKLQSFSSFCEGPFSLAYVK